MMRENDFDLGLAFDGDADRLIAVDPDGNLVDGDYILYICSRYMKEKNTLNKNMCVTTVMANLGLYKALDANKIDYIKTDVGDKYVFEEMQKMTTTLVENRADISYSMNMQSLEMVC